jgi:hypothetical protein
MTKTPQQIKNEVEKGCGKEIVTIGTTTYKDEYEDEEANTIYCGDYNNQLCPSCQAKLSILTEYDKSIKEMIEELRNFICITGEGKGEDYIDVKIKIDNKIEELLSKIGDDSEVEK